jgi:hypothetical protein
MRVKHLGAPALPRRPLLGRRTATILLRWLAETIISLDVRHRDVPADGCVGSAEQSPRLAD